MYISIRGDDPVSGSFFAPNCPGRKQGEVLHSHLDDLGPAYSTHTHETIPVAFLSATHGEKECVGKQKQNEL